jgi:hypothetical protein
MSCCETLKVDIRARYKTDDILEQPYLNPAKKSIRYVLSGGWDAATNSQFYATDSTSISLPVPFFL